MTIEGNPAHTWLIPPLTGAGWGGGVNLGRFRPIEVESLLDGPARAGGDWRRPLFPAESIFLMVPDSTGTNPLPQSFLKPPIRLARDTLGSELIDGFAQPDMKRMR